MATDRYTTEVREHLQSTYRDLPALPSAPTVDVAIGLPWLAIIDRARRIRADLIVLGPHSGHADTRGVVRVTGSLGSTVEGVITRESCPVMIVNRTLPPEGAIFKRILVGVDFSASCECALCFAIKAARSAGARIHVFHMLPVPPFPKYTRGDYEADKRVVRERIVSFCAPYLEETTPIYHTWGGVFPYDELLQCARNIEADLIVLGSHTKERNGKWYAGSVVERVGLRSPCPVIAISAPEALRAWKDLGAKLRSGDQTVDRRLRAFGGKPRR